MAINFSDSTVLGTGYKVLEQFTTPCDGSTISTSNGNMSTTNVTGAQFMSGTNYHDLTGSHITYQPPTGTSLVIYKYTFMQSHYDSHGINHYRFNRNGSDIVYSYWTQAANTELECLVHCEFPVWISGSNNNNTGDVSGWASPIVLKMRGRRYGGSNESRIHLGQHWDGTGNDQFHQPTVGVIAIG